jgi:hypothetical protein
MNRQGAQVAAAGNHPGVRTYASNADRLGCGSLRNARSWAACGRGKRRTLRDISSTALIQWYLVSVDQTVCFVRHTDHGKEFTKRFVGHSGLLCSFGM